MIEQHDRSLAWRDLRRNFEPHIFTRGQSYARGGHVRDIVAAEYGLPEKSKIKITAQVKGSDIYQVAAYFDTDTKQFERFECTCPYAEDGNCKHEAAVALVYLDQKHDNSTAIIIGELVSEDNGMSTVEQLLSMRDFSPEEIDALIAELAALKQTRIAPTPLPSVLPQRKAKAALAPDLNDYYFVIQVYNNCALEFFHKDNGFGPASVKPLLKRPDLLTSAQYELLQRAEQDARAHYARADAKDLGQLFVLLKESGIPVYKNWESPEHLLQIELNPKPLPATLIHETRYNEYNKYTHHTFRFSLPSCLQNADEVELFTNPERIILIEGTSVRVYNSSPILSKLVARIRPTPEDSSRQVQWGRKKTLTRLEAELTGEDIIHINEIISDARQYLGLKSSLEPAFEIVEHKNAAPKLLVDYFAKEETLAIRAVIDYGCWVQDVSESVWARDRGGDVSFITRDGWPHLGEYIFEYESNRISYAKKQPQIEIDLYKYLYDDPQSGFTKTLKCGRRHQRQIFEFYKQQWPYLREKCARYSCDIIFSRDPFQFVSADFHADISANLDAGNDWLAFDVVCYCGSDQITIEDLRRFIESGEETLRRSDGTLIHITNREELERFVSMLASFVERENNRFEGKAYHAPELEYVCTSSPHYTAQFEKGFTKFLEEAQSGKPVERIRLPARFKKILRPYQADGVAWLYFLRKYRFAGILADDMGLGKTIQTLVLLELERVAGKPSIVVCPKTLLYNWQSEAMRFAPKLKTAVIDGSPSVRAALIDAAKEYDLLITGYATMQKDSEHYEKVGLVFNYAVLDEAQFIKNHSTKNAQIVKKINANYRLALTGTPLENSVSELWSIFDFLMPGFLGSYTAFARRFHKPIMEEGNAKALQDLRKKVECFMLRRTKGEVLKELPPKVEQVSHCRLDQAQNLLYQEVLSKVKNEIVNTVEKKGFENSRIHILAALMKLRQVCNHPALLLADKDYTRYSSAKLEMFNELIEEIVEGKRKVLVFSQFTQMLDILAKELKNRSIEYAYLSGKTKNRQELVTQFNADQTIPVFLISLKAGGTGLNLTAADNVIIFDPWWNPSVENQAIDRAHRIGQQKSVNVFRLVTTGTIEEKILALQEKKKRLFDGVVGESRDLFKKLTWDDIKTLFQ